jgi:hypothetical protein
MLITVPNRQPLCSAAERKWRIYIQKLLIFASSPGSRVDVSVHVRNTCLVRVSTSACLFKCHSICSFVYVVLAQIILIESVLVYY